MYTIKHLNFSYPSRQILYDISTTIPENAITAIMGPNGCGKSTLLKHIAKTIPSTGCITLQNQPLESISASDYAKQVAALAQMHDSMIDDFLVQDIVLMGRYPHKSRFGNYRPNDYKIRDYYMEHIGIDHLRNEEIGHLSGGELQRVFIAKALTQEPSILLLDEPTNHLDMKYKVALMEELKQFQGTVIVVLHDLQLAARYADHIILMNHGRIIHEGTPETVLTPDRLEPIFEIPFHARTEQGEYYISY